MQRRKEAKAELADRNGVEMEESDDEDEDILQTLSHETLEDESSKFVYEVRAVMPAVCSCVFGTLLSPGMACVCFLHLDCPRHNVL